MFKIFNWKIKSGVFEKKTHIARLTLSITMCRKSWINECHGIFSQAQYRIYFLSIFQQFYHIDTFTTWYLHIQCISPIGFFSYVTAMTSQWIITIFKLKLKTIASKSILKSYLKTEWVLQHVIKRILLGLWFIFFQLMTCDV